jgi:hypothetical protein
VILFFTLNYDKLDWYKIEWEWEWEWEILNEYKWLWETGSPQSNGGKSNIVIGLMMIKCKKLIEVI